LGDSPRLHAGSDAYPGRRLSDMGIKVMLFVVVESVEARGQASLFMTGQTSDARVGGLRILLPFFGRRLVRSVGERGEYLVEILKVLFRPV
jgi:hypothetical protein